MIPNEQHHITVLHFSECSQEDVSQVGTSLKSSTAPTQVLCSRRFGGPGLPKATRPRAGALQRGAGRAHHQDLAGPCGRVGCLW